MKITDFPQKIRVKYGLSLVSYNLLSMTDLISTKRAKKEKGNFLHQHHKPKYVIRQRKRYLLVYEKA